MNHHRIVMKGILLALVCAVLLPGAQAVKAPAEFRQPGMQKRWLFIWRDMSDPKEIDRMIARFPKAQADGYNGVAFSYNIPASKAAELRQAARKYGLDLIAIVMGSPH